MLRKDIYQTDRLNALTDGMFAIAMTLLVLDLNVGELGEQITSAGLWHAIASAHESITSFVISFLLLGSMWAVHMRQFEHIKFADRRLVTINTIRLLIVVIMPLTTAIAGSYQDLVLGRMLLPINFLLLATVSYWEWHHALKSDKNLHESVSKGFLDKATTRNHAILILSFFVVIASAWFGYAAFVLLLLATPAATFLANKRAKNT